MSAVRCTVAGRDASARRDAADTPLAYAAVTEGLAQLQAYWLPASDYARGAALRRTLLAAPYHAAVLLDRQPEVGLGYASGQDPDMHSLVVNDGSTTPLGQQPGQVVSYPCEGSTVRSFNHGERPDPLAGSELNATRAQMTTQWQRCWGRDGQCTRYNRQVASREDLDETGNRCSLRWSRGTGGRRGFRRVGCP